MHPRLRKKLHRLLDKLIDLLIDIVEEDNELPWTITIGKEEPKRRNPCPSQDDAAPTER